MRLLTLTIAASLALALAGRPQPAAAQDDRDYVFTDDDGHLILRFVGVGPGGLDENQRDEVVNVQLSTMVHDRLRADARFEAEPVDAGWARSTQLRLEKDLGKALPAISAVDAECRMATCRLVLEHSGGQTVAEHQALMDGVERAVRALIAARPGSFEPVFLIAGQYKDPGNPYIKLFLQRADAVDTGRRTGG